MNKLLISTVSAAALACAAGAAAQSAPGGAPAANAAAAGRASHRLDPAEREARKRAAFDRIDANRDGTVTYAEYAAPRHRAPRDPNAPRRARGTGSRRGSALDADGDGVVTREEYMAAMQRRFERMDTDHDGRLSLAERRPGARRAPADE